MIGRSRHNNTEDPPRPVSGSKKKRKLFVASPNTRVVVLSFAITMYRPAKPMTKVSMFAQKSSPAGRV